MSLKIIRNTVHIDSVQTLVTDSSNVATTDTSGLSNITDGNRYLFWTQDGTASRRLVYINKDGLTADTLILTDADNHNGENLIVYRWSSYPTTAVAIQNYASFSETLIGDNSTDFYLEFTKQFNQEAFGLAFGSGYTSIVGKMFFGESVELNYCEQCIIEPAFRTVTIEKNVFLTQERISLFLTQLTKLQACNLREMLEEDRKIPFFLYDSESVIFYNKLKHVIIDSVIVTPFFNDFYNVSISLFSLRHY